MNPDPTRILEVVQELDPVVLERAVLRVLNEMQAKEIEELKAAAASDD